MRTTLSIDDDVLTAAKERAHREKLTVGEVLSRLARQALTGQGAQSTADEADEFLGFVPLPNRGEAISNALIDQLRDDEAV